MLRDHEPSAATRAQVRALRGEPPAPGAHRHAATQATKSLPARSASGPASQPRDGVPGGPGGPGGPRGPRPPAGQRRRPPAKRPNYTLRRLLALAILTLLVTIVWLVVKGVIALVGGLFGSDKPTAAAAAKPGTTTVTAPAATNPSAPSDSAPKVVQIRPSATASQGAAGPSDQTALVETLRLTSDAMKPKSVVAGPGGLLFAQNMMYRHSISVFKSDGTLVKTIPDSVDLSAFGISGHPGTSQGAPVEVAFTPDGKYAWVSNYSMYGKGFGPEGKDSCAAGDGTDSSYVYRVDVAKLAIDKVVPVGAVPKYVAVTPDGKQVLVTNWCSWNMSVIDAASAKETARVDLGGKYPRGIVASPDSKTAYVALMGSHKVVSVDLATKAVNTFSDPGNGPRHLVMSPDGKFVYVSNNASGTVVKIDRATGASVGSVKVGTEPRSMAISADGLAVYVVNYGDGTMSKITTGDMKVVQTVRTEANPIGITYNAATKSVWVACYGGTLIVYDDAKLKG